MCAYNMKLHAYSLYVSKCEQFLQHMWVSIRLQKPGRHSSGHISLSQPCFWMYRISHLYRIWAYLNGFHNVFQIWEHVSLYCRRGKYEIPHDTVTIGGEFWQSGCNTSTKYSRLTVPVGLDYNYGSK